MVDVKKETNKKVIDERKINDEELLSLFDRFDNSVSKNVISPETLKRVKNFPNWDRTLANKINIMKQFLKTIEKTVNMTNMGVFEKFNINSSFIFIADNYMPKIRIKISPVQLGGDASVPVSNVSIPLIRLLNMPAPEIYALLLGVVDSTIIKREIGKGKIPSEINLKEEKYLDGKQNANKTIDKINYSKKKEDAKTLLARYLELFFEKIELQGFKDYDNIAELVAGQILEDKTPEQISDILNYTFDLKSLNSIALEKVADFTNQEVEELRIDCAFRKVQELILDDSKAVEMISAIKQYESLVSQSLSKDFSKLVEEQKDGDEIKVGAPLKRFCENYVEQFMQANNLKPIDITFINKGELGTYIDDGEEGKINVNLTKIVSITELVSTLSHELTHAVMSIKNKLSGKTTQEGFGLVDNMDFDISKSTMLEGSKGQQLLKELNMYCYRINPNERQGRYGEISALKFMSEQLVSKDKMKKQLSETIKSFYQYQAKTCETIQYLSNPDVIKELERQISKLDLEGISETNRKLLDDRLNYIKRIMKSKETLDVSMEEESMAVAIEINKDNLFSEQPQM